MHFGSVSRVTRVSISIDELKNCYNDIPIYAMTRSMTAKQNQVQKSNEQNNVDINCTNVKVFEDFNTGFTNKIPRLRTNAVIIKKNGTVSNMARTRKRTCKINN